MPLQTQDFTSSTSREQQQLDGSFGQAIIELLQCFQESRQFLFRQVAFSVGLLLELSIVLCRFVQMNIHLREWDTQTFFTKLPVNLFQHIKMHSPIIGSINPRPDRKID